MTMILGKKVEQNLDKIENFCSLYLIVTLMQERSGQIHGMLRSWFKEPSKIEAIDKNNAMKPISCEINEGVLGKCSFSIQTADHIILFNSEFSLQSSG